MSAISRIILGIAVLIGAFVIKAKAAPAMDGGSEVLLLFGKEVSATTLTLIVAFFSIAGIVMIVAGGIGLMKGRK
ncbi:hypothetical protein [Haloferula sargassicola]|uniref:Uncharacterized protein n=1 Tax=Haloferula sargassicola TaxID=490096 RepID=A0ABP9UIJ1_9BACT